MILLVDGGELAVLRLVFTQSLIQAKSLGSSLRTPMASQLVCMVILGSTVRAGFFLLIAGKSERAVARRSTCPEATASAMVASSS